MKQMIMALSLLVSMSASAATIDAGLEKEILRTLVERCDASRVTGLDLEIVKSEIVKVDQGQNDIRYVIAGQAYENVGEGAFLYSNITVEAMEYAISNPAVPRFEVLSLRSALCNNDVK